MKFGIRFIQHVGNAREIVELAVLAEKAGFEYVWFPHDTFMKNTWVMTTAESGHQSIYHRPFGDCHLCRHARRVIPRSGCTRLGSAHRRNGGMDWDHIRELCHPYAGGC